MDMDGLVPHEQVVPEQGKYVYNNSMRLSVICRTGVIGGALSALDHVVVCCLGEAGVVGNGRVYAVGLERCTHLQRN